VLLSNLFVQTKWSVALSAPAFSKHTNRISSAYLRLPNFCLKKNLNVIDPSDEEERRKTKPAALPQTPDRLWQASPWERVTII
jgi:hypothetical protein